MVQLVGFGWMLYAQIWTSLCILYPGNRAFVLCSLLYKYELSETTNRLLLTVLIDSEPDHHKCSQERHCNLVSAMFILNCDCSHNPSETPGWLSMGSVQFQSVRRISTIWLAKRCERQSNISFSIIRTRQLHISIIHCCIIQDCPNN